VSRLAAKAPHPCPSCILIQVNQPERGEAYTTRGGISRAWQVNPGPTAMHVRTFLLGLAFVIANATAAAAAAPSFDCKTSRHPNERLICRSTELSELDNRMVALYYDIISYLNSGDQEELRQSQQRWLKQRLDCSEDFFCTKRAYTERIERLTIVLGRVSDQGSQSRSQSVYSVGGLALGGKVNFDSKEYRKYHCSPSDQFDGFVWCHYESKDEERRGSYQVSYTILHSPDGTAVYINRSQEPAYWNDNEVNEDIARYARKVGQQPKIYTGHSRPGGDITIARWGNVTLEDLDNASRAILAKGESPKKGILVDTIANLTRSARQGLPIYRVNGGAGFVWIASNQDGRGTLRFLAVDPSQFYALQVASPRSPSTPPPAARTPEPATETETVSSGTGFFVAPHLILSNDHVVNECTKPIQVRYPERASYTATLYGRDEANDLVLFHTDMPSLSVASFSSPPRVGGAVATYGFPYSDVLSPGGNFTLGNVSALTGIGDDSRYFQITTPIQPGNSGGPVLDMSGNVVGIASSQLNALAMMKRRGSIPQNVNFAIVNSILTRFLQVKGIVPVAPATRELPPADVAEQAKAFTVQVYCKGVKTSGSGVDGAAPVGWNSHRAE
jgi:uncharacterized protein YecT (DUF1311 family)